MSSIHHVVRRWLPLSLAACLAIAGCAAPGAPGGSSAPAGPSTGDGGNGNGNGGGGGGGGTNSEGPITIEVGGQSFGYEIGRCEIIDGVVYAQGRGGDRTGFMSIEATLPEWDREIAHSRRTGSIYANIPGSSPGTGLELTASRNNPGTSWSWTVSGSRVDVSAVMGDRGTATREDGVETFIDYHDVTITMECSGIFGVGTPGERMHEDFRLEEPPNDRVPGSVTVDLNGTSYKFPYLSHCQLFSNDVGAEGTSDEAYIYFYSEAVGVLLDFDIGDQREPFGSLEEWMLPPGGSLQSDFPFEGSGTTRTWTGEVVTEAGGEGQMTITVECTEGDAFEAAGTVSLIVDGVSLEIDEVVTCAIDGSSVDFFGRQSVGSVALLVTSGGTEILFSDGSGQSLTPRVEFDISGQRATWSGVLSGDRQASVTIDCS